MEQFVHYGRERGYGADTTFHRTHFLFSSNANRSLFPTKLTIDYFRQINDVLFNVVMMVLVQDYVIIFRYNQFLVQKREVFTVYLGIFDKDFDVKDNERFDNIIGYVDI